MIFPSRASYECPWQLPKCNDDIATLTGVVVYIAEIKKSKNAWIPFRVSLSSIGGQLPYIACDWDIKLLLHKVFDSNFVIGTAYRVIGVSRGIK